MEFKEYVHFDQKEILDLYGSVGWKAYLQDLKVLEEGFNNSLYILAYYDQDLLIGLIRVVGDGKTIIYVQDLLVRLEYQSRGIGTALLKKIMEKYSSVRQFVLITDKEYKTKQFYHSLGLKELDEIGCVGFIRMV